LKSKEFQSRYSALNDGLRNKGLVSSGWNFLILLRWVITSAIIIVLREYNQFQIILLYIVSFAFQTFIINGRPYDSSIENYISLINELFVSFYLYILMLLTDFMGENNLGE
jgi:hypothetical protein